MPVQARQRRNFWKEHWVLGLMLLLGLIYGTIYIFLVPPWQHYDEPGQFEHAWLIANHSGLPKPDEYDQAMRREVAASMIEHNFFDGLDFRPNLISITEPIWIGISQTSDPHAYYWFVALPLRLVQTSDITFQLYLARFVSLLLYLMTIAVGYAVMTELTESRHPLQFLVPLTMVMLPGFTDMMTAVNNDVGATAFFSAFIWFCIKTIRRGPDWLNITGLIGSSIMCFLTKSTVAFAPLLVPIPIILSLLSHGKQRRIAWGIIVVLLVVVFSLTLYPGEPAFWYDINLVNNATRSLTDAPHGQFAFKLRPNENNGVSKLVHLLPSNSVDLLDGHSAIIGAWIWANQSTTVASPALTIDGHTYRTSFDVKAQPHFYSFRVDLPENITRISITLESAVSQNPNNSFTVYYDGLVLLVDGDKQIYGIPEFSDSTGQHGIWGGRSFNNLIRNGSAEESWFGARRTIDRRFSQVYPASLSTILTSLRDWQGSQWYYRSAFINLFRTFWAKFGWGNVSLIGAKPYRPFVIVTAISIIAAFLGIWKWHEKLPKSELTFALLSGGLVWGAAFFRGIESLTGIIFIPAARYAYPAIIPTLLVFCFGWFGVGYFLRDKLKIPTTLLYGIYIVFFLAIDIISIISIMQYYAG